MAKTLYLVRVELLHTKEDDEKTRKNEYTALHKAMAALQFQRRYLRDDAWVLLPPAEYVRFDEATNSDAVRDLVRNLVEKVHPQRPFSLTITRSTLDDFKTYNLKKTPPLVLPGTEPKAKPKS